MSINVVEKKRWLVTIFLVAFFLVPIVSSYYKYYVTKDFDYLIEAECNPSKEVCFFRDCSNPEDCPPNGYTDYKIYSIKAIDFSKCKENSCETECDQGVIPCVTIECGESEDDVCSTSEQ